MNPNIWGSHELDDPDPDPAEPVQSGDGRRDAVQSAGPPLEAPLAKAVDVYLDDDRLTPLLEGRLTPLV